MNKPTPPNSDVRPAKPNPPQTQPEGPELLEKIVAHFTRQLRAGKHPSIGKYQKKFPQLADEIEEVLASVAMIEQLKKDSDSDTHPNQGKFDSVKNLTQIGSYQIVREIGRGGMGVVFEGVHESLGRRVAIKVMPSPMMDAEKHVARFKREASSAAKLHHTNIVSVYGVGEEPGLYYYVMDYIQGTSLSNALFEFKHPSNESSFRPWQQTPQGSTRTSVSNSGQSTQLVNTRRDETGSFEVHQNQDTQTYVANTAIPDHTVEMSAAQPIKVITREDKSAVSNTSKIRDSRYFQWVAEKGADLADALSYAHSFKFLHRDIKPSNLLLDQKGGIWITDFGLVKDESNELNLTKTGDVIGTPQYLAPESLEGKYDSRSEIYCLGLTLYEMVTLESAYQGNSPAEIIRAIATESPLPPRKLNPNIPLDLSTIVAKAISRDPASRYPTAEALRDDLLAFVDDRPIQARRPSPLERVVRWARRNPLPAVLSAVSAVLLTLVAVVASIGYWTTMDALAKEAEKSRRLTEEQKISKKATQDAIANLQAMREQYDRAEANISVTMDVFESFIGRYVGKDDSGRNLEIDSFRDLAGIETTLSADEVKFLKSLLGFYERIAELNKDNESLREEVAKAYRRVGNLLQMVGDLDGAIEAYKTSLDRYKPIWESSTNDKQNLLQQVAILNEMATAYKKIGQARQSHGIYNQSIELLQNSPFSENDPEVRLELARSLSMSAVNLYRFLAVGQSPIASIARDRSGIRRPAPKPDERGYKVRPQKRGMAWSAWIGGDRKGNVQKLVEQAVEILDDLIESDGENAEYRSVRGICYAVLSVLQRGNRAASLDNYRLAVDELKGLVEQNPDSVEYRYFLAITYSNSLERSAREELSGLANSIEQTHFLLERSPGSIEFHQLLVSNVVKQAKFLLEKGKYDDTLNSFLDARDSFVFLLERSNSELTFQKVRGSMAKHIGKLREHYRKTEQYNRMRELESWSKGLFGPRRMSNPQDRR